MLRAKEAIERGEAKPGAVWAVEPDGKGGFARRRLPAAAFQREQRKTYKAQIVQTRRKLGLSQNEFARLLGISVRTLHHWEQGRRRPSGAAGVLIRIAAEHPEIVREAAA